MGAKINDGLTNNQRYYRKQKAKNPEHNVLRQREFRKRNPGYNRKVCRTYYANNRERELLRKKKDFQKLKANGYSDARRLYQRVNCRYRRLAAKCDNPLTINEWLQILEDANYKCQKCGSEEDLTMDHTIPISNGGLHTKSNVGVLCRCCNSSKGAKI